MTDYSFIYDADTSACCINLDGSYNCKVCYGRKTCPEAEEHLKAQEEKEYEAMIEEELKASAIENALNIPDFDDEGSEEGTV